MRKLLSSFVLLLLLAVTVTAQDRTVTGTVTAKEDGLPLPGVSVRVKGTTAGTQTGVNGNYSVRVSDKAVLVFTYIGYTTQEVNVGSRSTVNVVLSSDSKQLGEVVVVAYGTATKESLTGSVSTVAAREIEKRPVSSVTGVLEGSAPGIQVNNTFGQPGSDATVRIRGFSSVNGSNEPLYVVDGVQYGGNISDLNPSDIESISVLKDASSAALYGNRASNGVILITTKRGKSAKGHLTASINQGVYTRGIQEYDRMNANEFMETMWLGYRNALRTSSASKYPTVEAANQEASRSLISDVLKYNIYNRPNNELFDQNGKLAADAGIRSGYNDLDWYKFMERKGHRQDYNVSGGASTEKGGYYFSGGYLDEKGYLNRSDFKRFTGRLNADISPKDWIKSGISVAGSHQIFNSMTGSADDAASFANPFMFARSMAPIYPVYLHDLSTGDFILDLNGQKQYDDGGKYARAQYSGRHVIWENELNKDRTYRNTINSQAYVDLNFLKDFKFSLKGDLNVRNSENQGYDNAIIGDGSGNHGRSTRDLYRYKNFTLQQQLTWNKSLNGAHNIDVLVGHENYSYNFSYMYGSKANEAFPGAGELVNFMDITSLTESEDSYRVESYLSRLRYNYKQKYFGEASFRRDGSSRFSPLNNRRWGNFWSLGGSWIISKENFLEPYSDIINNLKLRSSYGEVGNDQSASYYAYMPLYVIDQNANRAALYKSQFPAPGIKWETSSSFSTSLEGRLINRINFNFEYFDKRSQDLLFDLNLPLSAGATSTTTAVSTVKRNIGSVSNRGFEITLDGDVLKKKDLVWNIGANATVLRNKIVRLPEENREKGIISGTKKFLEGRSVYDFWLHQFAGVDQLTGNALYVADKQSFNVDGSAPGSPAIPSQNLVKIGEDYYTTLNTYAKRDWSGSAIPDLFGSFNTSLSWKNLSLSTVLTYSLGGKMLDYSYMDLVSMSGTPSALHTDLLKAWNGVPEGMEADSPNRLDPNGIPVVDFSRSNNNNALSSRFLKDASYLVVKNIAFSYRLPGSITQKLDLSGAAVNVGIENLATFTRLKGMNPQQSFNGINDNAFVTPRVFSLGLRIQL